jgi:phosphoribosyl 1,2-cyclic phosphodiesterase
MTYARGRTEGLGGGRLDVTFYGVRGSTPCAGDSTARYGGNTACVVLTDPGHDPILFDLGTGLRYFGQSCSTIEPLVAHALVTHLHWDHVQGLPFCPPLLRAGSELDVYGPSHDGVGFAEAFDQLMRPPFFPVRAHELQSEIRFTTLAPGARMEIAGAIVTAAHVPHTDTTFGYRVERDGVAVAYVSDHQQPDDPAHIDPAVLELCRGVDLLIHDAQFTETEFAAKSTWGHCTIQYAVHVAAEAGAKRLALFHHDPEHDDDTLDLLSLAAAECGARRGVAEVRAASEGLRLSLGAQTASAHVAAASAVGGA